MAEATSSLKGTKEEQTRFTEVTAHYVLAKNDLQTRISRKNGFDDSDKLYFGHIPNDWPFQAEVFDPRTYTVISDKDARLIGGKPKGRFVAREGSDEIGAYVLNELFSFQWDDVSRIGLPLVIRWLLMSQQARRYGASFGINKWHYEEKNGKSWFDGPDFQVIYARDALPNPSYSEVKHWFQYREWVTLAELKRVSDASKSKSLWKNLDLISASLREQAQTKGENRSSQYLIKAKTLRGLEDTLGQDPSFKIFELVHELRRDRWISFAPKLGVIIRDIANPHDHGEIPVVMLRYNPTLDDIYGVPETEIIARLQRALNALLCQYLDAINHDLYPPLMINPVGVRMQTIEYKPDAKWLMNRPGQDVVRMQTSTAATARFPDVYSLLVGSILSALGETTAGISQLEPFSTEKTATEVRETSTIRNVRDNYNQIMLAEALKKQAYFWLEMDRQFLFSSPKDRVKVIRIVGRDAINYFKTMGLDRFGETGPKFPVSLPNGTQVPIFEPSFSGQEGNLFLTKEQFQGTYDFIPDVESMQVASEQQMEAKLNVALQLLTNPSIIQLMAAEGKKPRVTELLVKLLETTRVIKNAEAFFENVRSPEAAGIEGGGLNGPIIAGGGPAVGAGGEVAQPVPGAGIPLAASAPGAINP